MPSTACAHLDHPPARFVSSRPCRASPSSAHAIPPDPDRPPARSTSARSLPASLPAAHDSPLRHPSPSIGPTAARAPSSSLGTPLPGPVEGRPRHRCSERPGCAAAHEAVGPAALAVGHCHPGEKFSATGLAQELQVELSLVSRCHPPACILVCVKHESLGPFPFPFFLPAALV